MATLCALCAGIAAPGFAQQQYPGKPIRLVISATPGTQSDMVARMITQKLHERWGQPVIVDNRPGGGGALAAAPVAKAAPDGHTLLYAVPNFVISAVLQPSLPYDPRSDFAGVSHIGMGTNVLVASPALGVKTLQDLTALAKARPGKLVHASSGTGTASQLTGARLNLITGVNVVNVAFKGPPDAAIEILAGRASYHVGTVAFLLPFIKEAKLVALGVTTLQRAPLLPDVPALGEMLPDFKRPETSHGLAAPRGTPRPILNQVNREIARILDAPDVKERLAHMGFVSAPSSPEQYDEIRRAQIEGLAKIVREAGLIPK